MWKWTKTCKAKWIILIDDPDLGLSILMWKERKENGKLGLFWGRRKNDEKIIETLKRELQEELWSQIEIQIMSKIWKQFLPYEQWKKTVKSVHYISFLVKISWSLELDTNEIAWLWWYPISDSKEAERIRKKTIKQFEMLNYAQQIIKLFWEYKNKHSKLIDDAKSQIDFWKQWKKFIKQYKEEINKNV